MAGQGDGERRSAPFLALDADRAMLAIHQRLGDCQAEPGAGAGTRRITLVEALKDVLLARSRYTHAAILHDQRYALASVLHGDGDTTIGGGELERVVQQNVQHLRDGIGIADKHGIGLRLFADQPIRVQHLQFADDVFHQGNERYRLAPQRTAGIAACQGKQIAYQAAEPLAL